MNTEHALAHRDRSRQLVGYWVLVVLGAMPFAVQPFFLGVMSAEFSLSPDELGYIASADVLGIVLASFTGFWWLKRFSFKRLIGLSCAVMVVGYAALAVTESFQQVFILRVVAGIFGHGIAFSLGTALLCRTERPDRAIAISVVTQIGFSAILLLTLPQLLGLMGVENIYLLLGLVVLLGVPLVTHVSAAAPTTAPAAKSAGSSKRIALLLLALVCYQIGLSSIWAFIESLSGERGFSLSQTGIMLAVVLPLSMLGSVLAGVLDLRFGRVLPVVLATAVASIGLVVLINTQQTQLFALAFLVHQLAWNYGIAYVYGALAEASGNSGAEVLAPGSQSLGTALGPILAGLTAAQFSLASVVWISLSGMTLCVIILTLMQGTYRARN
jgi:predicted MFS family arabinose efflux permease